MPPKTAPMYRRARGTAMGQPVKSHARTGAAGDAQAAYFNPAAAGICFAGALGAGVIANHTHAFAPLCGLQGAPHCAACYVAAAMSVFAALFACRWMRQSR